MDGVLIIDKPGGTTSHDVVNRVRRILGTKRVGHTGTLDPFATGLLMMLVGKATRLAQFVDKAPKEYAAQIRFGYATDTGDLTGKPFGEPKNINLTVADIDKVLRQFRGEIEQVPPMYSAKKVAGKKLYELARKGETIERKPLKIRIHELALLDADLDPAKPTIRIRIVCSAGTYIRTLAEDIGKTLGIGAHLTSLRRTAVGQFDLKDAITVEGLAESGSTESTILPIEVLVSHLPKFQLTNDRVDPTLHGLASRMHRNDLNDADAVAMFAPGGDLLAVGYYHAAESSIRPKIVLV